MIPSGSLHCLKGVRTKYKCSCQCCVWRGIRFYNFLSTFLSTDSGCFIDSCPVLSLVLFFLCDSCRRQRGTRSLTSPVGGTQIWLCCFFAAWPEGPLGAHSSDLQVPTYSISPAPISWTLRSFPPTKSTQSAFSKRFFVSLSNQQFSKKMRLLPLAVFTLFTN